MKLDAWLICSIVFSVTIKPTAKFYYNKAEIYLIMLSYTRSNAFFPNVWSRLLIERFYWLILSGLVRLCHAEVISAGFGVGALSGVNGEAKFYLF